MNFHILGEDTKIGIAVFTQSYPDSSDYWDGNWLNAKIECEIPGFAAKFGFQLRSDEIKDFTDQLKVMAHQQKGKAALYNLDGYVEIEGTMDGRNVLWKAALCYPAGNGASLKFDFRSDQSDLFQTIKELDGVLSIFPVVGTP